MELSMTIKIAAFAAFLAAGWTIAAAQDIGGRYQVQGTNANGSTYSGTAEITVTSKNTCRITWDTGSTSSGICMRNGIAFSAGYVMGDSVGLVIYEIFSDGSMEGLWTVADREGVGTEKLIPIR
jgi:hypothetical protein